MSGGAGSPPWAGLVTRALVLALLGLLVGFQPVTTQVRLRSSETRLLRDAANRESQGDFEGAERILLQLLEEDPASSGSLFALERVLKAQGQTIELLPPIDRFLARDPASSGVRYLKLRVLADVDSLDALRAEAEEWLDSDPSNEIPYREVARVYERAFGQDEALVLLRRGREATGRPDALALDLGDLLADMGDRDAAIAEWALAVGDDGAQTVTVIRRVQSMQSGAEEAGRQLVAAVAESPELSRRRAASRIALDLGLGEEALSLSQHVAERLDGRIRESFLADAARRAREQDLVEVAAWAYDELGAEASSPVERRQFDQRIIDAALAMGDTATALQAQRRVAASYSAGSVDRRRASAQVIRLEGAASEPEVVRQLLADFRAEYPAAPELDGLAASVAAVLNARGDPAGAEAVLEGVDGPQSALEKAYLLLGEGAVDEGRGALLLAVTGLPPASATPVIQFSGLFDRVSPEGGALLAAAGVEEHRGNPVEGAQTIAQGVDDLPDEDRPLLLAEAARIATRGGVDVLASTINRRIVEEYPRAAEVGDAAIALARFYARTPDGVPAAIKILEDLITVRPNAAVVPDARVELEKLRARS